MLRKRQQVRTLQLWVLFVAVFLPSGILAYLSIQGLLDERTLIGNETARRGRMIAAGLVQVIHEQCRKSELVVDIAGAELTKPGILTTNSGATAPGVCVVDKSYRLLAPGPSWRIAEMPASEDAVFAELQAKTAQIEQREAEGRFEEAYLEFQKLLASASSPQEKAVLINGMARTCKKAGRLEEAAELYQRVIREFPAQSGPGGISLAMVAHLECIRAAMLKQSPADALRGIQSLLDQIRLGQLPCQWNQFLFARRSLADWIAELRQYGGISQAETDTCRKQLDWIDAIFAVQAVVDLSREAAILDSAGTGAYVYAVLPSGIVGARWLSSEHDRAVVYRIDKATFHEEFDREVRTTFAYAERFDYIFSDSQGRPLLSSTGTISGEPHALAEVGGKLPFTRVAVNIVQSEAVSDHVKRRRTLSLAAVCALVVMIATSLLLVMRIVRREREMSLMKDNFVASVSHEMRLPLATIKMVVEMFSFGRVSSDTQAGDYYHILDDETERLTRLVNRVLDFGRMESGRKPYERIMQPVAPILQDAVARFRKYARSAVVKIDAPSETGSAPVDREGLLEVVINLLENAVKYSPANPTVEVRSYTRDDMVVVEVADKGIGIEQSVIDRIFEPFFRAENELTRETQGAGIGLAIVKHIVDAHGGRIDVQSEKGKGSVFTVRLPNA